jgi:hypothetical protein
MGCVSRCVCVAEPLTLAAALAPLVLPAVCCAKGSVRFVGAIHSQRKLAASQGSRGWRGIVHLCCYGGEGERERGGGGGGQTEEREKRMRFNEGVDQGRVFSEDTRHARGVEGVHTCARDTTQGEQHAVGNVSVSLSSPIYFQ